MLFNIHFCRLFPWLEWVRRYRLFYLSSFFGLGWFLIGRGDDVTWLACLTCTYCCCATTFRLLIVSPSTILQEISNQVKKTVWIRFLCQTNLGCLPSYLVRKTMRLQCIALQLQLPVRCMHLARGNRNLEVFCKTCFTCLAMPYLPCIIDPALGAMAVSWLIYTCVDNCSPLSLSLSFSNGNPGVGYRIPTFGVMKLLCFVLMYG